MRILLDESLPRPLGRLLVGYDVSTVADEGWTKLTNGALLVKAATSFDALLTADQNIEFQQNLATLPLAVIVLVAESNRLAIGTAMLLLLVASTASGQSLLLHGSAGPTLTDSGYSAAGGIGFAPPRWHHILKHANLRSSIGGPVCSALSSPSSDSSSPYR